MTRRCETGVNWEAIDAVIFDVDGTLFDHVGLRLAILLKVLSQLLIRRLHWRDIWAVWLFRRERERLALAEAGDIGRQQFERVAVAVGKSPSEVQAIISRWMYREPLAHLSKFAFPDVDRFIDKLHARGIRTGVFSDYPAGDKLKVLQVGVNVVRDATAPDVARLKPNPRGFIRVAELLDARPERCLVIGDREDRDGEAAKRAGFVFLKKLAPGRVARTREFRNYADLIRELDTDPSSFSRPPMRPAG